MSEPAGLRCRRCKAPYQLSWSGGDQPVATLTAKCPDCGATGQTMVARELAKQAHLHRAGSDGARTLMKALRDACDAANAEPD
jgi:DNA-directed RNA polymerase subunit RPC12/RpoP